MLVCFSLNCVKRSLLARHVFRYTPHSSLGFPCLRKNIRRISRLFFFNIKTHSTKTLLLLRKEVIQPHLPIRLPCYDFTPVIGFALGSIFPADFGHPQLPWCDGRCVQDPGTHSPRHSDPRLLATPTSCRRVSACSPNWDRFFQFCSTSRSRCSLYRPL